MYEEVKKDSNGNEISSQLSSFLNLNDVSAKSQYAQSPEKSFSTTGYAEKHDYGKRLAANVKNLKRGGAKGMNSPPGGAVKQLMNFGGKKSERFITTADESTDGSLISAAGANPQSNRDDSAMKF